MRGEGVQDCVASQGCPTSLATLSVAARCRIHCILDQSWFKQGDCMNKEQFNHRISPFCFHFPNMRERWNERRENCMKEITGKQRNVWYKLGLRRWSLQPNVCVIKQVWILHLRQKTFFFPGRRYGLLLFSGYSTTDTQFSHLYAMTSPFHKVTFLKGLLLSFILLKENMPKFIHATWRRICLWNALSQIPRFCLNKQLESL